MKLFLRISTSIVFLSILLISCQTAENPTNSNGISLTPLSLPSLSAVSGNNQPLKVVATTSIIGDVVGQVGGDVIALTVLMAPGQDPHSYEPSSGDLTAAADADVIFINGWNLEEGLVSNLENVSSNGLLVPVSAGLTPNPFGGHDHEDGEGHESENPDPHIWLDPHHVMQWVDNIDQVLETLDPDNAVKYSQNTADYRTELQALIQYYDEQVATIPVENRVLITNHDAFGYFAEAYGFEIIGTVLPGTSTLAEPSANDLAALVETMRQVGVCTIFAETTANIQLAETVAAELSDCDNVAVISLYTGAVGLPGSGADSYIGMMEANIDAIVGSLN
jgi:zinc/manganese transport system substrate-binding protein/manganese/iron transport system substrate-binding protein